MTALQAALLRPSITQALKALADNDADRARERNGIGFNQSDAEIGHKLAALPEEWLSPKQRRLAWVILRKYTRQLSGMGIRYADIPEPPEPTTVLQIKWEEERQRRIQAQQQGKRLDLVGTETLAWRFAYDDVVMAELRHAFPVRWRKEKREWLMRLELKTIPLVRTFCERHHFTISAEAAAELDRVEHHERSMIAASRAQESAIVVQGLKRQLYPFQAAGVAYAVQSQRCIIADEMGLGKTIQAIATAHHLNAYPVLCIVPASVKINWRREWHGTVDGLRVVVLDGRKATRRALYNEYGEALADVVVVNYDLVAAWADVLTEYGFKAIIADEAHYLKAPKAQRTVAATQIATGLRHKRNEEGKPVRGKYERVGEAITVRLALTGTPVLNRAAELAAILRWLGRIDEVGGYWSIINCSDPVALNTKLRARCFVRREKRAVLPELPAMQRSRVLLPIDNRAEYKRIQASVTAWVYERAANDAAFLATITDLSDEAQAKAIKAHQWSKAAAAERAEALVRINALKLTAAQGKIAAAKTWIAEFLDTGEPLIVFADHIEVQQALRAEFPGCAAILGEMNTTERQAQRDRFQDDPACQLIVCSLGAAREGITLTKASNVAFVEMGWTPASMDQAAARCYGRMNDLHGATAWYLVAEDTIDDVIIDLIEKKREITGALTMGEVSDNTSSVAGDVLRWLAGDKDAKSNA